MRNWLIQVSVAASALILGFGVVGLWFISRVSSDHQVESIARDCYPTYTDRYDASDFKGTLTRRPYVSHANGTWRPELTDRSTAEATADLFKRFREMPLTIPTQCVDERYRLTWIPTFQAPTVIRIWRTGDRYFAVTKRLSGKGGYDPGSLETEIHHSVTAEDWLSFESSLEQASFWKVESVIEEPLPNDGATWTFEGTNEGSYHFVHRITPPDDLKRLFTRLFELSGDETARGSLSRDAIRFD